MPKQFTIEIDMSGFDRSVRNELKNNSALLKKTMTDISQFVLKEAVNRAPIDMGNLSNDITCGVEDEDGKVSASVYVPRNCPSSKYAIPMHENHYNLGKNSQIKQGKVSVTVGRKYIERAFSENMERIQKLTETNVVNAKK